MTHLLTDLDSYIDEFARFIGDSPTSFHAVHTAAKMLEGAGFIELSEGESWPQMSDGSRGFVRRDGAIVAWRAGTQVNATSPVRVLGCHTDSPGLMLKPNPDMFAAGFTQAGVEVYGGPLLSTWFDRDLALAGRIVTNDGVEHLVRTAPMARVPSLAIHLDREANNGVVLDRQKHLQPIVAVGETSVLEILATSAGVEPAQIAGTDVRMVDTQPAERIGAQRELFAAPRLDNLTSVFAGLVALLETEPDPGTISVLAAFDHEELGSASRSGASGPMLDEAVRRLRAGLAATEDQASVAMHHSWCLSADAGHGLHPNYAEKHDPKVQPKLGGGVMLKVNANQRYATDAHGAALWRRSCERAGVNSQVFVSNNQVPCGSTIGPLTATRLGMRTLDAGVPLLSMHSVRELAHVGDLHDFSRIISAFFSGA